MGAPVETKVCMLSHVFFLPPYPLEALLGALPSSFFPALRGATPPHSYSPRIMSMLMFSTYFLNSKNEKVCPDFVLDVPEYFITYRYFSRECQLVGWLICPEKAFSRLYCCHLPSEVVLFSEPAKMVSHCMWISLEKCKNNVLYNKIMYCSQFLNPVLHSLLHLVNSI